MNSNFDFHSPLPCPYESVAVANNMFVEKSNLAALAYASPCRKARVLTRPTASGGAELGQREGHPAPSPTLKQHPLSTQTARLSSISQITFLSLLEVRALISHQYRQYRPQIAKNQADAHDRKLHAPKMRLCRHQAPQNTCTSTQAACLSTLPSTLQKCARTITRTSIAPQTAPTPASKLHAPWHPAVNLANHFPLFIGS